IESGIVTVWALKLRNSHEPPASQLSAAPSDNVQRPMNLIMPLRFDNVGLRGDLTKALMTVTDEVFVGLNNVGTVHFARFDIVAGNLCMFSVYDGEMSGYIRDFIGTLGDAFNRLLEFVKDPPTRPVEQHVDEFIAWVAKHDAFQLPEDASSVNA